MAASSGEESASDHNGPATTMRRRKCLRRRLHQQALRRAASTEKNPTEAPSHWPFWWLGAAAIAVFVTPGLSSAILNPTRSLHEKAMGALWSDEQRWWMSREDKMIFTPNYDDEHFFDAFKKPCPSQQGIRYRDDETLHRIAMQQLHAYPVMVQERPRPDMVEQGGGGGGESSSMRNDPTLEDIDLIDVLWREDIEREKSGGAAVAQGVGLHPSDQVERDLQLLTEKSVQAPLTLEESSRYEDLSKCYFEDFYSNRRFAGEFSASGKTLRGTSVGSASTSSSSSCSPTTSGSGSTTSSSTRGERTGSFTQAAVEQSSSAPTTVAPPQPTTSAAAAAGTRGVKQERPFPSDADVDALFEDLGKECGELNMLMPTEGAGMGCPINTGATMTPTSQQPQQQQPSVQQQPLDSVLGYTGPMPTADTLLQNVSLSTIAPYNPANLTELDFMVRDGTLEAAVANQQMVLPPIVGSLSAVNATNGFPEPTQFWFESAPDGTASYQSRQPGTAGGLGGTAAGFLPHQPSVIMDQGLPVCPLPASLFASMGAGAGTGAGAGILPQPSVILDQGLPVCPLPEPSLILLDPAQYVALLVAAQGLAVLNMSSLQLPPLLGLGADAAMAADLQQASADAAAAAAAAEDMNRPPAHHELTTLTGRMPVYETRPSARTASMSSNNDTQSLGAASSSSSSSSSPRYSSTSTQGGAGSDGENRAPPQSRFYGKLAPAVRGHAASISLFDDDDDEGDATGFFRSPASVSLHSHSGGLNSAVAPRRRGRQSKDEQLAAANGLPISAAEIADMSLPDLQKLLKADSLTEPQRQLIRKIRRRGKNKVAARTCRQRRGVARTEHVSPYENARILGYSNRH